MKKFIITALCVMMCSVSGGRAETKNIEVLLNGKTITFDQNPIIKNDRTFVPVRQVFEMFGMNVNWDGANNAVYANNSGTEILLSVGNNKMCVNGEDVQLDAAPFISGDRTFVPLRAISEALKCTVKWNEANCSVIITGSIYKPISKPTLTPTATPAAKPTLAPTATPALKPTLTPTQAPTTIPTVKPTITPVNTPKPTVIPTAVPTPTYNPPISDEYMIEQEVLRLVNEVRSQNGLTALSWADDIAEVARAHSKDMISRNFFSHKNPDGLSPFDRLKNAGITYRAAAENIAYGQKNAEAVMNSWMNSSGHRANILNSRVKEIGIGAAKNAKGTIYWTQMFAAR